MNQVSSNDSLPTKPIRRKSINSPVPLNQDQQRWQTPIHGAQHEPGTIRLVGSKFTSAATSSLKVKSADTRLPLDLSQEDNAYSSLRRSKRERTMKKKRRQTRVAKKKVKPINGLETILENEEFTISLNPLPLQDLQTLSTTISVKNKNLVSLSSPNKNCLSYSRRSNVEKNKGSFFFASKRLPLLDTALLKDGRDSRWCASDSRRLTEINEALDLVSQPDDDYTAEMVIALPRNIVTAKLA